MSGKQITTNYVSEWALIKRVNRKLRPKGERLRKARSFGRGTGWFYRVSAEGWLLDAWVDLEDLARDVGALAYNETLANRC